MDLIMSRKRHAFSLQSLVKKSSLTGLILFFAWILFNLSAHFAQSQQPVILPSSDAPAKIYSNQAGDDLRRLFVDAIKQAHSSITLLIYSLTDSAIIEALLEKSGSGVEVFIVSDEEATPGIVERIPHAAHVRRHGDGLMHQKILIADEKLVLVGSANFTPSSLNIHGNLVIGFENPSLAKKLAARAKSMDEEGGYTPLHHLAIKAGEQNLELWVLPDDPFAVDRMKALFRSAQKSIKVAMFTWTRLDFAHELIAAAKRGVAVVTLIDRYSGKGASAKIVRLFQKEGVPIYLSTGNKLLHHKFAYIDDSILVNGSANWTMRAFRENDDVFIVVYPLTEQQRAKMDKLWTILVNESQKQK